MTVIGDRIRDCEGPCDPLEPLAHTAGNLGGVGGQAAGDVGTDRYAPDRSSSGVDTRVGQGAIAE